VYDDRHRQCSDACECKASCKEAHLRGSHLQCGDVLCTGCSIFILTRCEEETQERIGGDHVIWKVFCTELQVSKCIFTYRMIMECAACTVAQAILHPNGNQFSQHQPLIANTGFVEVNRCSKYTSGIHE
jgi:hypothetical protein